MSDRRFSRGFGGSPFGGGPPDFSFSGSDEDNDHGPRRDVKKTVLVAGLAVLSWVATYVGMLELIEANMGDLPLVHKVIIGFSVAMLMTMVVWLLDQLFQPLGFFTRLAYTGGYIFLSIISIGFGFGFYWKVLESRSEGTRGAESAIASVQAPLQTAAQRLESLQTTLTRLKDLSQSKAEVERTQGTSCPNSRPGDGPRRKLRDDDAGRFAFASDFVRDHIGQVKTDMAGIGADLAKIVADDKAILDKSGTRNDFMKALGRRLDDTVTSFNAFRGDPQLRQIRTDLAERADKSQFVDGQGKTFACPDQQLTTMIRSVVASIDALPVMDKPKIVTVEGSDATIEAFRRLTTTFYGLLAFKLPPSADELRELQKKAVSQAEATAAGHTVAPAPELMGLGGLSRRDYVPLAIAIFVDLCLLLVSMGRSRSRLHGLLPKMKEAERGPVIQILSRFNEIHRDRQVRENFEIFRHVVFDFNGDYYAAIPLIAPYSVDRRRPNAYGPADVEALQQEAHLLANFFTSFEREKLFTRVMMPLIPTSRIQKKLWAQGSKFAHAEAFRLYKFRDGAWQEMILGAIMGAAKRLETDKKTRRAEAEAQLRMATAWPAPNSGADAGDMHQPVTPSATQTGGTSATAAPTGSRNTRSAAAGDDGARRRRFQPHRPAAAPTPPTRAPADIEPRSTQPAATGTVLAEPAANSNTATATAPADAPVDRNTVEVEAKERSVIYRMNRDDLPQSLQSAIDAIEPAAAPAEARPTVALPAIERAAPEAATALDDDGRAALDAEQARTLGGREPPELPMWDDASTRTDAAAMARRFGARRETP